MSAERESKSNIIAEDAAHPSARKRKHSGIATRGEGIRVQGDEPFDPYRFQTFEFTPAFRQRVLEAQLPLLEPRDSFLDLPPQSHQRLHSGANDVTLPEVPEAGTLLTPEDGVTTDSVRQDASIQFRDSRVSAPIAPHLPKRNWLFAGSLLMVVLGFACTYLAMRHSTITASAPAKTQSLPAK